MRLAAAALSLGLVVACRSLDRLAPDEHVVAAPISARANVVLRNLVVEYGSKDGGWGGSMGEGCAAIWASHFGYRAGVRRDRDDLVDLGRRTASRVSRSVTRTAIASLFGDAEPDDATVFAFPALFASGALGRSRFDTFLLLEGLERADRLALTGPAAARADAGLAMLLAAIAARDPGHRDEWLAKARERAEKTTSSGGTWPAAARAAIARVSGEDDDVRAARETIDAARYRVDPATGDFRPADAGQEVLSRHLVMIHALADMAQATGDAGDRRRALSLLDYVFSDAYFDGRFLVHHRSGGERATSVCSGCNFMALYLVDRLYGDTFAIDPLPPLPRRDDDESAKNEKTATRPFVAGEWDLVLTVPRESAETHVTVESDPDLVLPPSGRILFQDAPTRNWIDLAYHVAEPEELPERGGISAVFRIPVLVVLETAATAAFDDEGAARLEHGAPHLKVEATFRRRADGRLDAAFVLYGF